MSDMPNPSRVTAGVPTGGQFAATQRGESDIHLVDEEEAADPGRHLAEVRARFSHLPTSQRGPLASDFIDKTRAVGMSNSEALAYLDAGVLDADTAIVLRTAAASEDEDREAPTMVAAFNGIEPYSIRESVDDDPTFRDRLAEVPDVTLQRAISANMRSIMGGADRAYGQSDDDAQASYHQVCADIAGDALERDRRINTDVIQTSKGLDSTMLARADRAWFDRPANDRDSAIKAAWGVAQGTEVEKSWRATTHLSLPVRFAAIGKATRHKIGTDGYTQEHYDLLTEPWRKTIGPLHADDPDPEELA